MDRQYKLYYFEAHARAEPIRMLLHYVGQPYEEALCRDGAGWLNEWKPRMPFGQAPMLEVKLENGETLKLAQTTAILRYLADTFDLMATTAEERAVCDMFGDFISADITPKTVRFFWTLVGSVPKEERPELYETSFLPAVKMFGAPVEKQLKNNGSGFLVGSKVTWVDFLLAAYVEMMMKGDAQAFKYFPLIEEHYKTVCALKGVREYVEKRPRYPY